MAALFYLVVSCNSESTDGEFDVYNEFEKLDSIEVSLPDEYLDITKWTVYNDGKANILVEYGLASNGDLIIYQIDFTKDGYRKPLIIPREGPNGFNSFDASVIFKSRDSLFIFPSGKDKFFLYNQSGVKISDHLYNSSTNYHYYREGWFSSGVFLGKNLVIPTVNSTRDDSFDFFSSVSPIQIYNIETKEFTKNYSYPDFIIGKYLPSNFVGATISPINQNSFLVNYNFSDSVYIYNLKNNSVKSHFMGGEKVGSPKFLENYPDKVESRDYLIKEVDYEFAVHSNNKVYRVVSHLSNKNHKNLSLLEILKENLRIVTLIELDLSTNKLKYYKMPIAKYFLFNKNSLVVGGVSLRESDSLLLRKFYIYSLEE